MSTPEDKARKILKQATNATRVMPKEPVDTVSKPDAASACDWQWKQWQGKVVGSPAAIKEALETLHRDPKNAAELQKVIFNKYQKDLTQTLTDADEGYKYNPF